MIHTRLGCFSTPSSLTPESMLMVKWLRISLVSHLEWLCSQLFYTTKEFTPSLCFRGNW